MKALIEKLRSGVDLQSSETGYAVVLLLSDEVEDEKKVEFLTALHQKGESADEIVGFVRALMERALDPMIDPSDLSGPMIDVCGTGGAGLNFFNVSTTIMFVLAAGGAVVVKHGNRRVPSLCGSADVLEELGVPIHLRPEELKECVKRLGLGFIFARQYHPAFGVIAQVRERLARANKRTIFNLLGPLLNPARPRRQLIGVFSPRLPLVLAEALRQLGRERAWVVHGLVEENVGMDDVSTCGPTTIAELREDKNHLGGSRRTLARDCAKHPRGVAQWRAGRKCRQPERDSGRGNNRSEARFGRDQRREWICRCRTGPRFE